MGITTFLLVVVLLVMGFLLGAIFGALLVIHVLESATPGVVDSVVSKGIKKKSSKNNDLTELTTTWEIENERNYNSQ